MGVFNRRYALLGWTVWQFSKRLAKKKAKESVKVDAESKRPKKGAIVASLLAVGAGVMFWRKKSSGDDSSLSD